MAGALADEGGQYLQSGGIDPLQRSYVECDWLGRIEEAGETVFERARAGDQAFGRQGQNGRGFFYGFRRCTGTS